MKFAVASVVFAITPSIAASASAPSLFQASVFFPRAGSAVSSDATVQASLAVAAMTEISTLVIAGYADASGDPRSNKKLSLRRAQSVEQLVLSKGASPTRVKTIACGGVGAPQSGAWRSRRVDLVVLADVPDGIANENVCDLQLTKSGSLR